jgi:hypothetical protein
MPESVSFFFFGVLTVEVGEDALAGGEVLAVGAAVVAGVRLDLGNKFVLVGGGDQLLAAGAGHAEGHGVSSAYASRWLMSTIAIARAAAA